MSENEIAASKYWHTGNGGFTVNVSKHGDVEIFFGFDKFAHTSILLMAHQNFNAAEVGKFLMEAANKIEQNGK